MKFKTKKIIIGIWLSIVTAFSLILALAINPFIWGVITLINLIFTLTVFRLKEVKNG